MKINFIKKIINSKNKLFIIISIFSLLALNAQIGIHNLINLFIWVYASFYIYKNKAVEIKKKDCLFGMVVSAIFACVFYSRWSLAPRLQSIIENLNIDYSIFLIIISFIMSILSLKSICILITSIGHLNEEAIVKEFDDKLCTKEKIVILILSIVSILFFSKCSPLYPLNDWVDTNIFLTVGKSIYSGKILYKDIYEQKGPLLFFIYIIPAIVSSTSFIGTYFIEVLSAYLFLFYSYRTIKLISNKNNKYLLFLILYAFLIYTTNSFEEGGSVEEMVLPLITYSLYALIKKKVYSKSNLSNKEIFINGVIFSSIFWIKYTMLGVYIGYYLIILIGSIRNKQYKYLLKVVSITMLTFILVSFPIMAYFVKNSALSDLWEAYFYNNIFIYNTNSSLGIIQQELSGFSNACVNNINLFAFMMISAIYLYKNNNCLLKVVGTCFASMLLFIFMRYAEVYYSFILNAFMPIAFCLMIEIFKETNLFKYSYFFICIFIIVLFNGSPNVYLLCKQKEDMFQYKMTKIIKSYDDQTILNYGVLDLGLYTTTGTIPNTKYFCKFNVNTLEQQNEQERYVEEGVTNFVITKNSKLDSDNYILIDEERDILKANDNTLYYLYKRCK